MEFITKHKWTIAAIAVAVLIYMEVKNKTLTKWKDKLFPPTV